MRKIIYVLQYVNQDNGRTYYHYLNFNSLVEIEEFVRENYIDWTSYEIVVVRR